ncbi:MAG TPA: alpha/beta fold hydrolase [Aeromicrobium sp.]|nr:alpha/beta fold hydrolase [Aeromicrobium sp.]
MKPHAEPMSVDGGAVGVLLSHGFTGSPASMRPWAEYLADRGFTVRLPRLPGHGTTWQDLNTVGWDDWYGELDAALSELRERCDRVAVCGLSMGGALALRLAQLRPADVDAVVIVNPVVGVKGWRTKLVPYLKYLLPSTPGIGNDIKKPGADEVGYARTPLRALHSMIRTLPTISEELGRVKAPLLVFRATDDHVVDATSLELLRAGITSDVAFVTLTDSYHVATLDFDAPLIFERSAAFITEHLGSPR